MLLATTQVEDFDRFLEIFSTTGAEKRKEHGSKSALIFRDPSEDDRVWVIFDWDEQGWQSFVSDPEVPPIMKEAGHKSTTAGRAVRRPVPRLTPAAPWAAPAGNRDDVDTPERTENTMLLATTQIEDLDRFLDVFSTEGAEKRKQHGSKGALVFLDSSEDDRVWVIFDWDEQGWQSFVSDPEVPPIMQEAGHKSRPWPRSSPAATRPDVHSSRGGAGRAGAAHRGGRSVRTSSRGAHTAGGGR